VKNYEDDVLMICPDGGDGCITCFNCPCLKAHYSYECRDHAPMDGAWKCPDCRPIDEEQRIENEQDCKDLHVDVWGSSMIHLLEGQTTVNSMFKKFTEMKSMPKSPPGGTVTFRRKGTFKVDEPVSHIHDALSYTADTFSNNSKKPFCQSENEVKNENPMMGDPSYETEETKKEMDATDTDRETD
jgi:hypothetical protein